MRVVKAIGIIVLFCAAAAAQGTGTVTGIVLIDGKPIEGASVRTGVGRNFAHGVEVKTDAQGRFQISNLLAGTHSIWAVANVSGRPAGRGYFEIQTTVVVREGATEVLQLTLFETDISSSLMIKEQVTIAADLIQTVDDISKTVNLITAQEMRDRADITLTDSLRTIPGFRVQQLGGFGRTASIKTRGLRNQDTAILIDGVRFRDAAAITGDASSFLSDLTLTSVSRVEVLRGSGSSLYGTNAIGGTVDFITPNPEPGLHGQVSGAFGGYGLGRFRGNLSDGFGKFGYNLAVSRTAYTKGIDGQDNAHNTNFQSKLNYQPWSNSNFSGRFFISDAYVRLNSNPDTFGTLPPSNAVIIDARPGVNFQHDLNDPDSFQWAKFFNGQFVYTQTFGSEVFLQAHYSGLKTSRKNDDGPLAESFPFTSYLDGTIQTANAHIDWTRSVNKLTAGYEFEHEKFANRGFSGPAEFSTRAKQSSNTFYVQDLLGLFHGKLQLAGGFRTQWFSLDRPTFSSPNYPTRFDEIAEPPASYTGDASASYYFERTNTKIRAHVGNGYRVPSLYERFGSYFFFGSFFGLGNPLLKPERSFGLDGGVEQKLFDGKLKLTATYFYTEVKDEITYLPTDDFNAPSYFNFDKHFSRGTEFSGDLKLTSSTNVFASYTFTNSDIRNHRRGFLPPLLVTSVDKTSFGIPKSQFTLVATQRIGRFWINGDLVATSSYLAPIFSSSDFNAYTYRFKGNRRVDLTAGYIFPLKKDKFNLRLHGTVENVFDNEYYENGFQTPGRNGRVGLSFGF